MRLIRDGKKYDTASSNVIKQGVDLQFLPIDVDGKVYKTESGNVFMTVTARGQDEKFATNDPSEIAAFLDSLNATEQEYEDSGVELVDA